MSSLRSLSASQARRIALAAQGLADPPQLAVPGARHLRGLVDRLGVVQIDSVNVLVRTHYLPAFSRLGAYPREHLEEEAWGRKKSLFEYWGHEASLLPMAMQPLFRWRMEESRSGEAGWTGLVNFARERRDYIDGVLEEIEKRGIRLIVGTQHERIEKTDAGLVNHLSNGVTCGSDVVMFATGRVPYVKDLGLEAAGVKLNERGAIAVDRYSRTSAPNIYAVGDVTDRINLTPVAIREAAAFAATVFGKTPTAFDHEMVATAVFSQPPIGCVGMTETEARRAGHKVDIYMTRFRPMKGVFYGAQERVLMKLVVDADSDVILGCHIVGPEAPEMIQMAAVAVKMGVTKAQWDNPCALHPTLAEELVTMREKRPELAMSVA